MPFEGDVDETNFAARSPQSWLQTLWHRVTLRLALVIGLAVFITAVAIDSFHHQASAADMTAITALESVATELASPAAAAAATPETYLTYNPQRAERLGHSALTGASLTRCRLTTAHLFTQALR